MDNNQYSREFKARIFRWTIRLVKYLRIVSKSSERMIGSIIDQLLRSGTSVGANYIEAIASPTTKDFRKFLSYSLKSANESKYWLALIKFSRIDNSDELEWLLKEIIEIANLLGKSVSTMYKNNTQSN